MDIDALSFPHKLLVLLVNISEADFVSFDLELSGIPSRLPDKPRGGGHHRVSLEDRYAETKEAANRYQILQVGITCARFDYLADRYILRPYNINISPLLNDERLDVEREITLQTGATLFLLNHGFDFNASLARGVQYLSREEAQWAKKRGHDRVDGKNPVQDIQLQESDVQSLDFVRRVRDAINAWRTTSSFTLEITTHTGLSDQPPVPIISRFEKRLVHQLVRAEFPNLRTIPSSDCVKVTYYDKLREADYAKKRKGQIKNNIIKQSGFRWIFEALAQGDIESVDPSYYIQGLFPPTNKHDIKLRFDRAQERLRANQPVLVGHNLFTDLVYFYRTFHGQLPDTLDEFCKEIHVLFPRIIDTKYLATHAEGDLNASPSLEEVARAVAKQPLPNIVIHGEHSKYDDFTAFHEAGYDSLLTATILLRLSTSVYVEHKDTSSDSGAEEWFEAMEGNPEVMDGQEKVEDPVTLPPVDQPLQQSVNDVAEEPTDEQVEDPPAEPFQEPTSRKKKKRKNRKRRNSHTYDSPFSTRNQFEKLALDEGSEPDMLEEDALPKDSSKKTLSKDSRNEMTSLQDTLTMSTPLNSTPPSSPPPKHVETSNNANASKTPAWENEDWVPDTSKYVPLETRERDPMELMPAFDDPFWNKFGNSLRIYGTQERVLRIADWVPKSR